MNIGIVVPHLGSAQIGYSAINAINSLVANHYKDDLVLFFEQLTMPITQPQCATMCINEIMSFKGLLITTTLNTTAIALARNSRKDNKILFYLWDLEWMRPGKNAYLSNYKLFNSVDKVIARSVEHAKAIANYSNRTIDFILEEFNINEMIK